MCNWRAWLLPGLLNLIVLTAIAVLVRGGPIEADVTARALATLEADGTPWASADLDGRDLTLSGTAPTLAAQDAAINAAERVAGVFRVDSSGLDVLPLADPYTLTFTADASSVTVSGSFPSGVTRASLLDDVRAGLGSETLIDETTLARGAPVRFADFAGFGAAGLSNLASGSIALDGATLTVAGDAVTIEAYNAELARLTEPPAGLTIGEIALNPPIVSPYTWGAEIGPNGVTLSGFVPDEAARSAILEAAGRLGDVTDTMELGSGAPEGFLDASIALLEAMQGLENPSASITDRDLSLSGDAPDNAAYEAANVFLGMLPSGFDSLSGRIAPPLADPFMAMLSKAGDGGYTLSGVLPDETARALILDALDGITISDTASVARGAPTGLAVGDLFASLASTFEGLREASATLTDNTLDVTGVATSLTGASDIEAAIAALATDAVSVTAAITPGPASPFTFDTMLGENSVSLEGFVPNEDTRTAILGDLAALFPGRSVADGLVVADGAPEGFLAMVQAGLRGLGQLSDGQFSASDTDATLSGRAFHAGSMERLSATTSNALPSGFGLTADIGVLDPPETIFPLACQIQFRRLLAGNAIRFETGSAAIDPLSNGLLDRLVRVLQSCPNARVEIGGHTDAQGSDEANLALSEARAQAVSGYIVEAGIEDARIDAVGYGESAPIADNETDEGRAQNRRIEFTVQR